MWTFIIIAGIITMILLRLLCVGIQEEWNKGAMHVLLYVYSVASLLFYGNLFSEVGHKDAQIQALKGKFDYKMEIRYELKGSVYIPVDTVFTKIN